MPLSLTPIESSLLRCLRKKHVRPFLVDGKWDGKRILRGRAKKIKLIDTSDYPDLLVLLQKLLDNDYDFTPPAKKAKGTCRFPSCSEIGTHPHHITYSPSIVTPLCAAHHREITIVNINQAERVRHKLSNKHRWWAWSQWLKGELRPILTANAASYMESFRD